MKPTSKYYVGLAREARRQKDIDKAIEYWTKAIELSPRNWYYYFERASLYGRYRGSILDIKDWVKVKEEWNKAIADWTKVIKFTKDAEEVRHALGERAVHNEALGFFQNAIEDLDTLRRQKQLDDRGYCWLASMKKDRLGQIEEAIEDLSEGIGIFTDNVTLYLRRGDYYRKVGKYAEAKDDYQFVITLVSQGSSSYIHALYGLGQCLFHLEQYQVALDAFIEVHEYQSQSQFEPDWSDVEQQIELVKEKLKET